MPSWDSLMARLAVRLFVALGAEAALIELETGKNEAVR